MRKLMVLTVLIVVISVLTWGGLWALARNPSKVIPLPDFTRPEAIKIDENQIYITEDAKIYIFTLKDFKLKKTFGRSGEGPKEFIPRLGNTEILIDVQSDYIFVKSLGRVSLFTKQGEFIKVVSKVFGRKFFPFGNRFVALRRIAENEIIYWVIELYDSNFKREKEIFKMERNIQIKKNFNLIFNGRERSPLVYAQNNKIFVEGRNGDRLHVFDHNGTKLYCIEPELEKLAVSGNHKNEIMDIFKRTRNPAINRLIKEKGRFPEYVPPIRFYHVIDQRIYVLTYIKDNGKSKFYIFDLEGKLLKKVFIPFFERDILHHFPYAISNGKLYQLVDNPGTEEWELHVEEIK